MARAPLVDLDRRGGDRLASRDSEIPVKGDEMARKGQRLYKNVTNTKAAAQAAIEEAIGYAREKTKQRGYFQVIKTPDGDTEVRIYAFDNDRSPTYVYTIGPRGRRERWSIYD